MPNAFYRSYLDDMIDRGVDAEVSNAEPDHMAYALTKMLEGARQSVRIFPSDVNDLAESGIYGNDGVMSAARTLLSKEGARLLVVLPPCPTSSEATQAHFLRTIADLADRGAIAGTMEVRMASPDAAEFLEENDFIHPMVVMDESAYRIQGNGEHNAAFVNFGNARDARRLAGFFDDVLYDQGQVLMAVGGSK